MYKVKLVFEGWSLCFLILFVFLYRYIVNKKLDFFQLIKLIYCSNEKIRKFQDWVNIWIFYFFLKVNQLFVFKDKLVSLIL